VKRRQLIATVGAAMLLLAGCSSTGSPHPNATGSSAAASTAPDTIVIQDFMFHPMALTVNPGATVTVINKDSATHTVTSTATPHAFDSGNVAPGATVTFHAPDKPGSYSYICDIHQYMQGTITVS
jgi:plastocyanin